MATENGAPQAYIAALRQPDEDNLAALGRWLADDVLVAGLIGAASGRQAALEALAAPDATRLVSAATWTDPVEENGETLFDANLPAGMPLEGLRFGLQLAGDGRILRVGQQMRLAAPPEPQPLAISAAWKEIIDGALANGTPVIVGYVDAAGIPHLSPRGSVQVLNEQQVALWAREPEGGILKGIATNPNLALFYRDPKTRASVSISGKAHVADGPTRETVYNNQPAIERNFDGRKRGVAIVVDVDLFEAMGPAGRARMVRG